MSDDTMFDQQPLGPVTFAENPEPRCPCLLLLDTSGSMAGKPIAELNAGLRSFYEELQGDSLAVKRVEVALVSFGPVRVISEFNTADFFLDPTLEAEGDTPAWRGHPSGDRSGEETQRRVPGKRDLLLPALDLFNHRRFTDRRVAACGGSGPGRREFEVLCLLCCRRPERGYVRPPADHGTAAAQAPGSPVPRILPVALQFHEICLPQ